MKFLFWLLALFAGAVSLALSAKNPGLVIFDYPPHRFTLSLTLFVISLLALLIFAHFSIRFITALMRLPNYVRTYREQRLLSKGRSAMMDALTAFFEGRYASAEKAALRAMESGEKSGINSIIAARSAHELRDFSRRDSYLASIAGKSVGESTMRLIAQTEFMLDQKQPQLALDSLKELKLKGSSKHLGALQLELKAQQQAGNWEGVLAVVTQLEKRSAIVDVLAQQMRQHAWLELLRAQTEDINTLQLLWKRIPEEFKHRPQIAALAARTFIQLKDCKSAQQLLISSLNTQWDTQLVSIFGDCQTDASTNQIEQAEKWLNNHSNDAGLLLALGKLCLQQSLWGKSQSYLDASNSLLPSHAAYSALAQLTEKLHKPEEAQKYLQLAKGLQ